MGGFLLKLLFMISVFCNLSEPFSFINLRFKLKSHLRSFKNKYDCSCTYVLVTVFMLHSNDHFIWSFVHLSFIHLSFIRSSFINSFIYKLLCYIHSFIFHWIIIHLPFIKLWIIMFIWNKYQFYKILISYVSFIHSFSLRLRNIWCLLH